ncbi:MAG: hemolysin family protein [Eubacterium sp.]|nr:hemolysin family protein [Eubacterium sp.]
MSDNMISIIAVTAGILVCIILSGFFSASEMAYSSCNAKRLQGAAEDGNKKAGIAHWIVSHFQDAISAILIGNNFVNIACSSLGSVLIVLITGSSDDSWIATAVLTVAIIIFGETMPKIIAKKNANRLAEAFASVIRILMYLFKPIVWVVVKLADFLTRGIHQDKNNETEAVEHLKSIIETAEDENVLDEDQSELAHKAIDFSEISASEVMTARVDMDAIDIDDDWEEIIKLVSRSSHSRIPVYRDSIDNIIGTLYLNHFLKEVADCRRVNIQKLLMKPCFIYKTTKLPDVFEELKNAKQHLAIVTDEFGGTMGVITMEDVLEQIVGEIWDENDKIEPEFIKRADGTYIVDGDTNLHDFLDELGMDEEKFEAESDTVGGWTMERFGTFPSMGDTFEYEGLHITVLETGKHRVDRILVKRMPEETDKEKEAE